MSSLSVVGTAYVDNGDGVVGELRIEQDVRIEWSRGPRADECWSHIDSAGHFHAYDSTDKTQHYPTLNAKSEHKPCDGSCGGVCGGEGYSVTAYYCRICGEQQHPGLIQGEYSFPVPGLSTWTVIVHSPLWVAHGQLVSVRYEAKDDRQWFGVADVGDVEVQSGSWAGAMTGRTTLHGRGPLGRRALPKPPAVVLPDPDQPVERDSSPPPR